MKLIGIAFIVLVVVELLFHPRFDYTTEGNLLIWYGRKTRNFKKLF